jgi:hypothetical protein
MGAAGACDAVLAGSGRSHSSTSAETRSSMHARCVWAAIEHTCGACLVQAVNFATTDVVLMVDGAADNNDSKL